MRWLVSLLGLGGGVAAGHLGVRWLEDVAHRQAARGTVEHDAVLVSMAAYMLIGSMVAGVLGAMLALQRRGHSAGTVLLTAGLVPGIFDLRAFLVTCVLILAGLLGYGLGAPPRPLARHFSPTGG